VKRSFASRADRLVNSFAEAVNQNPSAASMLLAIELEWYDHMLVEAEQ